MYIAVFGDLHGNILLAFQCCARWQQETGQQLDLILQVGDLGVFPDRTRFDRATKRHSERNPAVFSFQDYFTAEHPKVTTLLEELQCPLLFVRGNHEDHGWLDNREHQFPDPCFPVDAYLRLLCLKTGVPFTFLRGEEAIIILGIGRIGRPASSVKAKPHYIQPEEQQRLGQLSDVPVDLLLSHDAPRDRVYPGSGSVEVQQALRRHQPWYHFYGHYGGPAQFHLEANGSTRSYKLADLGGESRDPEQVFVDGSMGILHWHNRNEHTLEMLMDFRIK